MMIFRLMFIIISTTLLVSSCSDVTDGNGDDPLNGEWLIPKGAVFDGGPGKDGIPALRNPHRVPVSRENFLTSNELVIVYKDENDVRIYPHRILDWHEIINDDFDDYRLTVSYCPLTGSAVGYEGNVDIDGADKNTTFGVSGLLYNSNLILYDRATSSYWSQMLNQCVAGRLAGQFPKIIHLLETSYNTARAFYPMAEVVSNQTGVYPLDQYAVYPYGDYRTNDERLLFPVSPDDARIDRKERVLGVIGELSSRAYRFENFGINISLIEDELDGQPIVVAGSRTLNFMVAYQRTLADTVRQFTPVQDHLPVIMHDAQGNAYDIFGDVVEGPLTGNQLQPMESFIGFWFAWGAFYPGIEIYN